MADYPHKELTGAVIGGAIEVHKALGPGLLESAYEECLCHELQIRGHEFRRQVSLPVRYKGVRLDCGYRIDLVVEDSVLLELKSVEVLAPVHEAQLLTYSPAERDTNRIVGQLQGAGSEGWYCSKNCLIPLFLCVSVSLWFSATRQPG